MFDLSTLTKATVISPFGIIDDTDTGFQPLWQAEVAVLEVADPQKNRTFRNLFLDSNPRRAFDEDNVLLPGRVILLCHPQNVTIDFGDVEGVIPPFKWLAPTGEIPEDFSYKQMQESLQNGSLSLLLVEPLWPEGEISEFAQLSCLAGEISLDKLLPQDTANARLYETLNLESLPLEDNRNPPASRLIGALSVHSSGLTIFGQIALPWKRVPEQEGSSFFEITTLKATFQLSWRTLGISPNINLSEQYFLRIEIERLTQSETNTLLIIWQQLGQYINPGNPQNPLEVSRDRTLNPEHLNPNWTTLEPVTYSSVPHFYWKLSDLVQATALSPSTVHIQLEDFNLILSDRNLYNPLTPPTSLAKLKPELIQVAQDGEHLNIIAIAGSDLEPTVAPKQSISNQLQYTYDLEKSDSLLESWELIEVTVAFSPVETPRFIREIQNLAIPTWDRGQNEPEPIAQPLLWGIMPLEDGWTELPIPNLTEQIYIDSDIANFPNSASKSSTLFQAGAVSYGNQEAGILAIYPNEQPWNFTFTDAQSFKGEWQLTEENDTYKIEKITLDFTAPKLIINGLFWLSKEPPSIENALPDVANWFSCFESIPLRSVDLSQLERKNIPYPSLVQLKLDNLSLASRQEVLLTTEASNILDEDSSPFLNLSGLATVLEESNYPLSEVEKNSKTSTDISVTEIQEDREERFPDWSVKDQKENVEYFIQKVKDSEPLQYTIQTVPSTTLLNWSFNYSVDPNIFGRFITEKVLPANLFAEYPPLVWRRHPSLPMIQSLPLTQSKNPPNYPSTSRQYVPFELKLEETEELSVENVSASIPKDWKFGISNANGTTEWPQLLADFEPAQEWLSDIGLSSLSLPGLFLYPPQKNGKASGLEPNESEPNENLSLVLQLRYDLPYTDEFHALAQLPKVPRDSEAISPLPDSPIPEPAQPLIREIYGQYWRSLNERASLASVDGSFAFISQDSERFIQFLVEPYLWKVNPFAQLSEYPGELQLQTNYALTGNGALEGISGRFKLQDNQLILKTDSDEFEPLDFILKAGSMEAYRDLDSGFSDQRGLTRQATKVQSEILITPVTFQSTIDDQFRYELTSTLRPIALEIEQNQFWQFWFRDLPIQVRPNETSEEEKGQQQQREFIRKATQEQRIAGNTGAVSQYIEDINDPEALSREHNFLSGYEWRLADGKNRANTQNKSDLIQPIPLLGLHFYPLTLERVVIEEDVSRSLKFTQIELIGRLQLPSEPVDKAREWEELGNAVRIIWVDCGQGLKLNNISVESSYIEWPLYFENTELSDAPRLLWNNDNLTLDKDAQEIRLNGAQLSFILFDELWKITLDSSLTEWSVLDEDNNSESVPQLRFYSSNAKKVSITGNYTFNQSNGSPLNFSQLAPKQLDLTFDLRDDGSKDLRQHEAFLSLDVRLGQQVDLSQSSFYSKVRFDLIRTAKAPTFEAAMLFGSINIRFQDPNLKNQVVFKNKSIQFAWKSCDFKTLYLLPGIKLKSSESDESLSESTNEPKTLPGFAALTFTTTRLDNGIPKLELETAFLEAIILCQWNSFLQSSELLPDFIDDKDPRIFGSSAGDVTVGYTGYYQDSPSQESEKNWKETFLLNGFLEVKNLISFPQAIRFTFATEPKTKLIFPGLINGEEQPLDHLRHTARILLNQHQIDGSDLILEESSEALANEQPQTLFNLKSSWKILAVVENQLIDIIEKSEGSQENFVTDHLEVLYEFRFDDNDKTIIHDRSGRTTPINLKLQTVSDSTSTPQPWEWIERGGLAFKGDDAIAISETIPTELIERFKSTNAITIEAWVKSTDPDQEGPARIVTLSGGTEERNFTLGQGVGLEADRIPNGKPTTVYSGRLRTDYSTSDDIANLLQKGRPSVYTPKDSLTTSHFTHVVYVRHTDGKVKFYLDGIEQRLILDNDNLDRNLWDTAEWPRNSVPGTFSNWEPFRLALGNEIGGTRAWKGEYKRLAIYSRALTPVEIRRHYRLLTILSLKPCDRRWTGIQQVNFFRPQTFKMLLNEQSNLNTLDPRYGIETLDNASEGYLSTRLREQLSNAFDQLPTNTLLVEATTAQWLSTQPISNNPPTRLQFLPNGVQLATLSDPGDFLPSDPHNPKWLLLNLPFLGRLQASDLDFPKADSNETAPTSLQIDPIYFLKWARQIPNYIDLAIAQALSHWGSLAEDGRGSIELIGTSFYTALGRTWARLDPLSLEQSWIQLQRSTQNNMIVGEQSKFSSVMNTQSDTPGLLSRPLALEKIYQKSDQNSLLINQGVSDFQDPSNLQLLYIFNETSGTVVHDVSGAEEPLDLTIQDGDRTEWITAPPEGLSIQSPTILRSDRPATRLIQACQKSNEISIEVWVKPTRLNTRFGFIVSLAENADKCNFILGQGVFNQSTAQNAQNYYTRLRATENLPGSIEGLPAVQTPQDSAQRNLMHIVYTRQSNGQVRMYIDGIVQTPAAGTTEVKGDFSNWKTTYRFALANDPTESNEWIGEYYLVAVYSRALSADEIKNNFDLGIENRRKKVQDRSLKSWHLTGLQLASSPLANPSSPVPEQLNYYPAVTVLPTSHLIPQTNTGQENIKQPNNLAVSPYIGLKFQSLNPKFGSLNSSPEQPTVTLPKVLIVSVELLGLEAASGTLKPISSFLQEVNEDGQLDDERILAWAKETQRRLAPESPLAILRFREIRKLSNEEASQTQDSLITPNLAPLIATYSFAIIEPNQVSQSPILSQQSFRLRTTVEELRFREGQFGGMQSPTTLEPFELAPPLTIGVQPLFLTPPSREDVPVSATPSFLDDWPWGLSSLRLSIQYTQDQNAAIGSSTEKKSIESNDGEGQSALWWQALQYQVQYRSLVNSSEMNLFTGGLPSKFRSSAIKSFLPVNPQFPFPSDLGTTLTSWQPVLPGFFHCFTVGDRPGAMMAIRPQLFKQQVWPNGSSTVDNRNRTDTLSGSIPAQHRVPRPVPLPLNDVASDATAAKALQPWASYFNSQENCLVSQTPVDEAFFADCQEKFLVSAAIIKKLREDNSIEENIRNRVGSLFDSGDLNDFVDKEYTPKEFFYQSITSSFKREGEPESLLTPLELQFLQSYFRQVAFVGKVVAKGLRMKLDSPARGMISTSWNGDLIFSLQSKPDPFDLQQWQLQIELSDGSQTLQYLEPTVELESGKIKFTLNGNSENLQKILSGKTIGTMLLLSIKVKPRNIPGSFYQFFNFTLRIFDPNQLPLPLEPYFINFEDPEYNRRLASSTASASRGVKVKPDQNQEAIERTIKLVCDRTQYNPDSVISLRFDWDDEFLDEKSQLQFKRIDPETGIVSKSPLTFMTIGSEKQTSAAEPKSLTKSGQLHQIIFLNKQGQTLLSPGDALMLELMIQRPGLDEQSESKLFLQLAIVEETVNPVPESAYALLKQVTMGEILQRVECSRFAWNPLPTRIELVCAEDLRTEIVRRRAVFNWIDIVRAQSNVKYYVQKITQSGSSYVPELQEFIDS